MGETTQLHNTTPDELVERITESFKAEVLELKKQYEYQEPDELLTRSEVSRLLKINISSVHNWAKKGVLKKHCIGGRVYYKRSEIIESLEELK
jgi:hypothetical protein